MTKHEEIIATMTKSATEVAEALLQDLPGLGSREERKAALTSALKSLFVQGMSTILTARPYDQIGAKLAVIVFEMNEALMLEVLARNLRFYADPARN